MQFNSKSVEEHGEGPLADEGKWEELVDLWQARSAGATALPGQERAYVVSVVLGQEPESSARLGEILGLVRAQGSDIVGHEVARVTRPDPRALFRSGRAKDIAGKASQCGANTLIVDAELSPSQCRNLEDATGLQVRDREAVILNVFQKQVRTQKARIQVEIAHLQYLRPRIRGLGLEMDQQAGGVVGSRGPGETASELLARQLDGRLATLRSAFARVCDASEVQRRRRSACKRIALVGYTNAGKTSLMNALTGAGLSAADRPFETLDATSRCLTRHGGDVLISDTVGFIRNLPERLLASFESTLSEIHEATVIALVIDVADSEALLHLRTTEEMLHKLGAESIPRLYILNKIDAQSTALRRLPLWKHVLGRNLIECCSHDAASVARLKTRLLSAARREQEERVVLVPYAATQATALVYSKCRVKQSEPRAEGISFTLEADAKWLDRIALEIQEMRRGE